LNRRDCCGDRLAGTTVHIGNVLCGTLPGSTATAQWYTVTCATPLSGNNITIRQDTTYTALQLATVEVYGYDNCHHQEATNSWGAHKCRSASDCTGARTCSRFQWCTGDSACASSSAPVVRPTSVVSTYSGSRQCHSSYLGEELDKEGVFADAARCALAVTENGCEYFQFSTSNGNRGCRCCTSVGSNQHSNHYTIH